MTAIEVKVEALYFESYQVLLEFSVSDTGIGIPEDKVSSLFNSFQQLDSYTTRKYGGTGLGLAIVRNLVSMMGGKIGVESKLGEGSRFFFKVPLQTIGTKSPQDYAEEACIASRNRNRAASILLAEDNKVNQLFMIKLLEKKNLKVDVAENGRKVLEKLKQSSYDLILMDIQMPEMDGYDAALAIRKEEELTGNHIAIIALTANATEEDRDKCLQTGMDDYLAKPVKSEKLYNCLSRYINME